ncbi:unnamed protein product [Penicillium roqueforti FM164]|uniref:Genomic scaffold, ProqFM164S02 n=1 Tax=Penicillium roqueforti (strain FM164) TaxID=1365484 RepID=W6Q832_PENRF|nr:unnamed protein product [Penicillium roqueforti FM164]
MVLDMWPLQGMRTKWLDASKAINLQSTSRSRQFMRQHERAERYLKDADRCANNWLGLSVQTILAFQGNECDFVIFDAARAKTVGYSKLPTLAYCASLWIV